MVTAAPFLVPKNPYSDKANTLYENRRIGFLLSLLKTEDKKAVFLEKIQQLEQYRKAGHRALFMDLFAQIEYQLFGGFERTKAPRTVAYQTITLSSIFSFGEEGEKKRQSIRETVFGKAPLDRYFQYLSGIGPVGMIDRINNHLVSRSVDRGYESMKGYWILAYA